MSRLSRPRGTPRRVPAWVWKWLKWRLGKHAPKPPAPAPSPTPVPRPPKPKPKPSSPLKGCDYVSGPSAAELKAAGIKFVCRYLSTAGNPKNLTVAEAKALHSAGIAIVLVFETTANRALGGFAAGKSDASSALAQAHSLGVPFTVPIYFAVDFDATPSEQLAINSYLAGASSVIGKQRVGIYGGFYPVKRALDAGRAAWAWQAYAWSGGQWDPRAQIRQVANAQRIAGHGVDIDRAVHYPYGAWEPR